MPFQGFFGVIHHALQSSFCVVHHAVQGAFGVIHGKPLKYKNCAHHGYEQVEMEKRNVPEDETLEARDEVERSRIMTVKIFIICNMKMANHL